MSGLGRLSVCMMEGLTTQSVPVIGYGLRYDYGSFIQRFDENGEQIEIPDFWASKGIPWEIARQDVCYKIQFGGRVQPLDGPSPSDFASQWISDDTVLAVAFDNPIPGYKTLVCNVIRLWKAMPTSEFDLQIFQEGKYYESVAAKQHAE